MNYQDIVQRLLQVLAGPASAASAPPTPPYAQPYQGLHNSPYGSLENAVPPPQAAPPPVTSASYGAPSLPTPPRAALPTAPQAAAPWLALGNQNRTAAFDPTKDMNDPGNIQAVDQYGRAIPRGLMGPV